MGGPFQGVTLVETGNPAKPLNIQSDSEFPMLGSLTVTQASITSPQPFGGQFAFIKGQDALLVHGDVFQQIGMLGDKIGNATTNVSGDENETFYGTRTTIVYRDDDETIYGQSKYTYIDSQNNTLMGSVTTNYSSVENGSQPTSSSWWQDSSVQGFGFLLQLAPLQVSINGIYIQLVGIPSQGTGIGLYATLVAGFNVVLDFVNIQDTAVAKLKAQATDMEWAAFKAKISGASVGASAGEAGVAPSAGAPPIPPLCPGRP